jgi:hypothetical protein
MDGALHFANAWDDGHLSLAALGGYDGCPQNRSSARVGSFYGHQLNESNQMDAMRKAPTPKQVEFNAAMQRFEQMAVYRWTGNVASLANVSLPRPSVARVCERSVPCRGFR